jgi:hypothetical protein
MMVQNLKKVLLLELVPYYTGTRLPKSTPPLEKRGLLILLALPVPLLVSWIFRSIQGDH